MVARNAADLMVFDEGEELPVFWDLLGGPESYATGVSLEVGTVNTLLTARGMPWV